MASCGGSISILRLATGYSSLRPRATSGTLRGSPSSRSRAPTSCSCICVANRKAIQEVITLVVFSAFSVLYLREELRWNTLVGFGCIVLAVFFVFKKW